MKTTLLIVALCFFGVAFGVGPQIVQNNLDFFDIEWIDTHTAMGLTRDKMVWRTTDVGVTWKNVTGSLPQLGPDSMPAYLYPNPADETVFYIRGSGQYCWFSTDKGSTWNVVSPGRVLINLRFHPKQREWILAGAVDLSNPFSDTLSLYYTTDLGKTWSLVNKAVYQWSWGDAGVGDVPESRIYLIASDVSGGQQTFYYTENYGESYELLVAGAYRFIFMDHQIFVAAFDVERNKVVIKVTDDLGQASKFFLEAKFPYGSDLEYNGYRLLDDYTGAVYLGVVHSSLWVDKEWGNVYVSDVYGVRYISSLDHVSSSYPFFDFGRMQSLEGIYLANTLANWADSTNSPPLLETFITMDNGGEWKPLKAPHKDSQGNPIVCTGKCSLHLHIETGLWKNIAPMYTTDTAVGLILAVGNVGSYLSTDPNELNTYLSRDGGLTWIEVMKGNHIYEIGDHGGVIVFAPLEYQTNTIYYTLDQGKTVNTINLGTSVTIENIITEPGSTALGFLMLAIQEVYTNGTLVDQIPIQFGMDFSGVFTRDCDPGSDYEVFSPTDGRTSTDGLLCMLGRQVTYSRKKPDALCFNNEDYDPILNSKNCTCTEDDWECDFDFQREPSSGACVLVAGAAEPAYPPSFCPANTLYYETKGYQKIAGDSCQGGIDHSPVGPYDCPGESIFQKNNLWIIAAVLVPVVVVVSCVVAAVLLVRNEKIREKLPFLKSLSEWKVGYQQVNQGPDTLIDEEDESIIVQHHEPHKDEEAPSITESVFTAKAQPKVDDLLKIDSDKGDKKPSEDLDHFDPRL